MSNLVVHFEIHASEPKVLIDFYSRLLGWTFTQFGDMAYWAIDTGEGAIGMAAPGNGINGGLTQRNGPRPEFGSPINGCNVVVGVDDVDATFLRGSELGAREALPPDDMQGVGRVGYLLDPDGNVFGLISPVLSDGTNVTAMGEGATERQDEVAERYDEADTSGIRLQEHTRIKHKGRMFTVDQSARGEWQITDESGLIYGIVRLESPMGESHRPVYNGHVPSDDDPLLFGSSWDSIVRGLINQYEIDNPASENA